MLYHATHAHATFFYHPRHHILPGIVYKRIDTGITNVYNGGMFKTPLLAACVAVMVAPAFATMEWMTDLEAAKTKAAAENKAVLVDFTGSDWCGWCIKLRKEVFDTPEFAQYAADKFIPVEIDLPNDASKIGGQAQLERNHQICDSFRIDAFPTILVLTPQGDVVGGFSGGTNMAGATQALNAALANAQKLNAAAGLQGAEKAKALMAVYSAVPEDLRAAARSLKDELIATDTTNVTGIQDEVKAEQQRQEVLAKFRNIDEDDYAAALSLVDEAIANAHPQNVEFFKNAKIEILQRKIYLTMNEAKTVEDIEAIKQMMLNELVPALPEADREEVKAQIELEFADPQAMLKQLEEGTAPAETKEGIDEEELYAALGLTGEDTQQLKELEARLDACGEDIEAIIKEIDTALPQASPALVKVLAPLKAMVVMHKGQLMVAAAKTEADIISAKNYMLQAIENLPEEERTQLRNTIEQHFADPAEVLRRTQEPAPQASED